MFAEHSVEDNVRKKKDVQQNNDFFNNNFIIPSHEMEQRSPDKMHSPLRFDSP